MKKLLFIACLFLVGCEDIESPRLQSNLKLWMIKGDVVCRLNLNDEEVCIPSEDAVWSGIVGIEVESLKDLEDTLYRCQNK